MVVIAIEHCDIYAIGRPHANYREGILSSFENAVSGRILRPRQFVPTPPVWLAHGCISERFDGKRHWINRWPHPEIADLGARHEALMSSGRMSSAERAVLDRIEQLFLYAEINFAWWFDRIEPERLMPDNTDRPEPEAVIGRMPSWEAFDALIGAVHRARAWIEAVERRHGVERATAASIWAEAYGIDAEAAP